MPNSFIPSITGTDGRVPVYQPDSRWTTWRMAEIYKGQEGQNKFVPKVRDLVIDTETGEWFIVVDLDITTLIARLEPWSGIENVFNMTDNTLIQGLGGGSQYDTYRVYCDKSVTPHVLSADSRTWIPGSDSAYAKIFRGADIGPEGKVISNIYDTSNSFLSHNIPLELAAVNSYNNHTIKTVTPCYTMEDLIDGELVTLVVYSDLGRVMYKRQMVIENTGFIRSVNAAENYIVGVSIKSPFLTSEPNSRTLEFPMNVPLQGLELIGVVTYRDGSTLELPVDGTRFEALGFQHFTSTIIGQTFPVVITYKLQPNEVNYTSTWAGQRHISERYTCRVIRADGAYTGKLFGAPVWIDAANGYRLEWYYYNLDRNFVQNVTPYVTINPNTGLFNPKAYGVNQRLSVSVYLDQINPAFKHYKHVQTLDVALLAQGSEVNQDIWQLSFNPDSTPVYGRKNKLIIQTVNENFHRIRLMTDDITPDGWLQRYFYDSLPLFNPQIEAEPPKPTHVTLMIPGGGGITVPVSNAANMLSIVPDIAEGSTLFLKWIKQTVTANIHCGVTAVRVVHVNSV